MKRVIHGRLSSATAAVGRIPGISQVRSCIVVISGLTNETITVTGLMRTITGPTEIVTAGLRPINLATGTTEATDSALGNGTFLFDGLDYEALIFTKSSTSETGIVDYRLSEEE